MKDLGDDIYNHDLTCGLIFDVIHHPNFIHLSPRDIPNLIHDVIRGEN
jgi:hypothetical protein